MFGVNDAAEGSQRGAAVVLRMRGEMQFHRGKANGICLQMEAAKRERIKRT